MWCRVAFLRCRFGGVRGGEGRFEKRSPSRQWGGGGADVTTGWSDDRTGAGGGEIEFQIDTALFRRLAGRGRLKLVLARYAARRAN